MMPNESSNPPTITMTPVGFAPPKGDAVGSIIPARAPDGLYPIFIPLAIMLLTLNFATLRDIVVLNHRMTSINQDNAHSLELMKDAGKQTEFCDDMRSSLAQLATTDPAAARISAEMFGTSNSSTSGTGASRTPAK